MPQCGRTLVDTRGPVGFMPTGCARSAQTLASSEGAFYRYPGAGIGGCSVAFGAVESPAIEVLVFSDLRRNCS